MNVKKKAEAAASASNLYSNEKYTWEIGFLFHFREWISWRQIVLYHLTLISSSERQELFFIIRWCTPPHSMQRQFLFRPSNNSPRAIWDVFHVLIYTWKRISKEFCSQLKWRASLYLVCLVSMNSELFCSLKPLDAGRSFCQRNRPRRVYVLMKNSTKDSAESDGSDSIGGGAALRYQQDPPGKTL